MGWHDANIYGLTIEKNEDNWTADFLLDLDYILKWVHPIPPAQTFTFWVAPCTLIFKECFDLHIDFKTDGGCLDLMEIANLYLNSKTEQKKNKFVYESTIELQLGLQPEESPSTDKTESVVTYWGVEDIQSVYNNFILHRSRSNRK